MWPPPWVAPAYPVEPQPSERREVAVEHRPRQRQRRRDPLGPEDERGQPERLLLLGTFVSSVLATAIATRAQAANSVPTAGVVAAVRWPASMSAHRLLDLIVEAEAATRAPVEHPERQSSIRMACQSQIVEVFLHV